MANTTIKGISLQAVIRAFVALLAAVMMVASVLAPAQAFASKDAYTYTVRLYSGAQGTFSDGTDCVIYSNLKQGSRISLQQGDVVLDDSSKYYVRGWKVSGRDNDTTSQLLPSLIVTSDIDLVVSYGILGENVAYTVNYVDDEGNELYPSETFYGNVGERPILAYRYIEGYQPQAYNLTGELLANADQNVFTFTYSQVEGDENITVVDPSAPVTPEGQEGEGANAVPTVPVDAATAPATAIEPVAETTTIDDDATPAAAAPAEIEEIRDDETPLASGDGMFLGLDDPSAVFSSLPLPAIIGILAGGLALIAAAIIIFLMASRRKKHNDVMDAARAAMVSNNNQNFDANGGYNVYTNDSITGDSNKRDN